MKSIIQMIYDGEIDPGEIIIPQNEDYRSLTKQISDELNYFKRELSAEDIKRFEKLDDLIHTLISMYSYANFEYAFKFGTLLMAEIFFGYDAINEKQ